MPPPHSYFIQMFTQLKSVKILIFLGILDTLYLSYEYFTRIIPPCPTHSVLGSFVDCGKVLTSPYATIFGVPVALIGLFYYLFLLFAIFRLKKFLVYITTLALIGSGYFMYLQLFVLHSICIYCTFSALVNLVIAAYFIKDKYSYHASNNTSQN